MVEPSNVPDAARFILQPERIKRFVDLYRQAKDTKDERIVAAADDALKYFRDAESALTRMMAAEATVNEFLSK